MIRTIVIDPGHGGEDTGVIGGGGTAEKDITLAAASNATNPNDSERLGTMQTSAAR